MAQRPVRSSAGCPTRFAPVRRAEEGMHHEGRPPRRPTDQLSVARIVRCWPRLGHTLPAQPGRTSPRTEESEGLTADAARRPGPTHRVGRVGAPCLHTQPKLPSMCERTLEIARALAVSWGSYN